MFPCVSLRGYIFSVKGDDLTITGPQGETLKVGDDLSALSGSRWIANFGYPSTNIVIGDYFIYVEEPTAKYVSLDGKTTIESVVAKFNDAGQLLYTDETGSLTYNQDSEGEDVAPGPVSSDRPEKSYANLSNFIIDGKWKNVGTYTFGQVSSGAIVAFDGTHCNVVSPQDTYAVYKDGDNYRLDCTTLLGETLSFTIRTVDEDNIDIYYGSNYLEMTRVG